MRFDSIINRKNTNSLSEDGFRHYLYPHIKLDSNIEYIRMWVADMDFAVDKNIINAIKARLNQKILGYTKVIDDRFYSAFSSWSKKYYDYSFESKWLFFSHGVVPNISNLIHCILQNDDEKVAIFTPSYAPFKNVVLHNKKELVTIALKMKNNEYFIDFDEFDGILKKDKKIKILIFCNPHNPTGKIWSISELQNIIDICKKHQVHIISDEIHCDLLRVGAKHIPLAKIGKNESFIYSLYSTSKTFNLAGLMFSHCIINDEKIAKRFKKIDNNSCNPLSLEAAIAAYNHSSTWLENLKKYLDSNFLYLKEILGKHLPETKFEIPQATYLAWINLGAYLNHIDRKKHSIGEFFAKRGLLLEDEDMFVDNAFNFIRLNLSLPKSQVKKGMKILLSGIKDK